MASPGFARSWTSRTCATGPSISDRLDGVLARDEAAQLDSPVARGRQAPRNAMAYDDVIRVPTSRRRRSLSRGSRGMGARDGRLLRLTEFMHPACRGGRGGMLPAGARRPDRGEPALDGAAARGSSRGGAAPDGRAALLPVLTPGRHESWRRRTLRHRREVEHREAGSPCAGPASRLRPSPSRSPLPAPHQGLLRHPCPGLSKFDRVLSALPLLRGREDGRGLGCVGCARRRSRTRQAGARRRAPHRPQLQRDARRFTERGDEPLQPPPRVSSRRGRGEGLPPVVRGDALLAERADDLGRRALLGEAQHDAAAAAVLSRGVARASPARRRLDQRRVRRRL
jgi:hypothetical protein